MYNNGSMIIPGSVNAGLTEADVNALIAAAETTSDAAGEHGWVSGSPVSLAGKNFVDLVGIPVDANSIEIAIQGGSTTGTSSMYARVFDGAGALIASQTYFGYVTNKAGSTLSSVAVQPGDAALICGGLVAPAYFSGDIILGRCMPTTFRLKSCLFEGANRKIDSVHVTASVGSGITGVRLLLGTAGVTWDDGDVLLRWRR
ncbi:hypothetical protein GHL01_00400 [Sinorhizobium meliloti]|uniref:hypothetical protein n=1 Tax=Rhizobium meliloti TaxID=382 RepID=UPI0012974F86|nr:hypothetical protein [Sinorhizobium meliloti]MQV12205.1 hypothetical protein [Sinorhizobium meliloti]